jgi:hypothetical protein
MRSRLQRSERDYLAVVSVTIVGVFLVAMLILSVSMVVVERWHVDAERAVRPEHVAFARANQRCEQNAPPLVNGWTLGWNASTQTFTCVYDRNGRRSWGTLTIRLDDLMAEQ